MGWRSSRSPRSMSTESSNVLGSTTRLSTARTRAPTSSARSSVFEARLGAPWASRLAFARRPISSSCPTTSSAVPNASRPSSSSFIPTTVTDGFAIVDKPAGMTSHDVVGRARKQLSERRIGHAGTLDPDATGVLLLGIGRATRLLQFLSGSDKTYVADIALGSETDTLDAAGVVTATYDMRAVTIDDVIGAAARFVGDIEQVPPMVSAIKIGGRRLHELAREGLEVERPARRVHIARLEIQPLDADHPARAPLVFR